MGRLPVAMFWGHVCDLCIYCHSLIEQPVSVRQSMSKNPVAGLLGHDRGLGIAIINFFLPSRIR